MFVARARNRRHRVSISSVPSLLGALFTIASSVNI
jgi:hypothetical protein